jgi:hypothetical protein
VIHFVNYDEQKQELTVDFPDKGKTYVYVGVPADVANGMKWANTVGIDDGVYFHSYIRGSFPFRRVA